MADAVRSCSGLRLQTEQIDTNIVIFHIDSKFGTAEQFAERLKEHGVLVYDIAGQSIRMVTHLDVSQEDVERAAGAIQKLAKS